MHIELSRNDAELVRDVLRRRIEELDKEISRTDRLAYKRELQDLERTIERVVGDISAVLHAPPAA